MDTPDCPNQDWMVANMNPRCQTCVYWQDYNQRVFARLSSGSFSQVNQNGTVFNEDRNSDRGVELRLCRFQPPPTVQQNCGSMYTDANYACSAHKPS